MSATVKALYRRTKREGESLKEFARRLTEGSGTTASAAGRWLASKLRRRGGAGGVAPSPPATHSKDYSRNGASRKR